jgi:hypothetical protein
VNLINTNKCDCYYQNPRNKIEKEKKLKKLHVLVNVSFAEIDHMHVQYAQQEKPFVTNVRRKDIIRKFVVLLPQSVLIQYIHSLLI